MHLLNFTNVFDLTNVFAKINAFAATVPMFSGNHKITWFFDRNRYEVLEWEPW